MKNNIDKEFHQMVENVLHDIRNSYINSKNIAGWAEGSGCTSKHFLRGDSTPLIIKTRENKDV